jgi:toxin FitB
MSTLLDTNVLSELPRARPEPAVWSWFAAQAAPGLFVSAVTQAEMLLGAGLLPAGQRRAALQAALLALFDEDFQGRVLPFDAGAAGHCVDIVCGRRALERPISQPRSGS